MDNDLLPLSQEEKLGFSLQTLCYPDTFELKKLGNKKKERLEKAVAIVIDDDDRIKRCRFSGGYIHERREAGGWKTVKVYSDLDELEASDIYSDYARNLSPPAAGPGEEE
jgi:hypothetical protein